MIIKYGEDKRCKESMCSFCDDLNTRIVTTLSPRKPGKGRKHFGICLKCLLATTAELATDIQDSYRHDSGGFLQMPDEV